jgi:hypothetical protein
VSGKNIDLGEALRSRISSRVSEATAKYFDGAFPHVTVGKEAFGFRTECVIHLDSGIVLKPTPSRQMPMPARMKRQSAWKKDCAGINAVSRIRVKRDPPDVAGDGH